MTDLKIWYVRRGEQVRGPFNFVVLTKLAKLGRLKPTDEISDNRQDWKLASSDPELFLGQDAEIMLKDEERSGLDRREPVSPEVGGEDSVSQHQREGKERRKPESKETSRRRKERTSLLNAIRSTRSEDHFPRFVIVALAVLVVMLAVVLTPSSDEIIEPDCEAQAQPGVNWDNCQFQYFQAKQMDLSGSSIRNAMMIKANLNAANLMKSNISYSNLTGANLANVHLENAILKGTNLRSANLRSATLRMADLSYSDLRDADLQDADLTQVILHKAIWLDGRICAKGSVGRCQ